MENLNLALVSSPKPLLLGHSSSKNVFTIRKPFAFGTFRVSANSSSSHVTRAASKSHQNLKSVQGKVTVHTFASISSSNSQETTSDGRTIVESKTADLRSQIRRKGDTNQASSIRNPWQQSDQTQSHSNHETQLKQSRDVALATAAKAKLLLRELKTVKADLAFAKARCAQLEEENKLLREREGSDKGLIRDDDDLGKVIAHTFASISSSNVGSPLFWIGVGVGFSALFSVIASRLKKYAMQQALNTMMGQMNTQNNNPFDSGAFSPGSPFPFPMPSASGPATPAGFAGNQSQVTSARTASQSTVTVDIPSTKVEAAASAPDINVKEEVEVKNEPKKSAFVDVSPEETVQKNAFERFKDVDESSSFKEARALAEASQNGAPFNQGFGNSPGSLSAQKSVLSVDALEKMMEDPTVQKMVYPYLPEEMRKPSTFKWMLQNPEYRQRLEEMLNNMGGGTEWDSRMMDTLKNFDLNSPAVKQQFDQIGLSPEEVISKIMTNPDVAMAFQNPRVQAAIMDCSQNPMSIAKYQNDKEVMDVFYKISELFPGVSGPP